jgi:serine/threonine-protein kinase
MNTKRSAAAPAARPEARVGTLLANKWRLEGILAMGGMGTVFAARHRNGNRVAIKILHASANTDEHLRFRREGFVANAIDHPNVISILDDGVAEDGAPFLVMEQLRGDSLDKYTAPSGPRLRVQRVIALMDTLLGVLERAHAAGIVHRDIKPENLFLTETRDLKVLDFGIARVVGPLASVWSTKKNLILGTPGYMAPEQACANNAAIEARTDLWGVGATMFSLLSGAEVHESHSFIDAIISAATRPARSLATVAPDVPREIVAVVDRALAFRSADRWKSASAMREALREAAEIAFAGTSEVLPSTKPYGFAQEA